MKKYNVIAVFDDVNENLLMCKRLKEPFKGLYNLVGGKVESDNFLEEAYRELVEETGISKSDINLIHLMNFTYVESNYELQVFYGVLNKNIELIEEINKLEWISLKEKFCDTSKFAGDGNIFHMIENIRIYGSLDKNN